MPNEFEPLIRPEYSAIQFQWSRAQQAFSRLEFDLGSVEKVIELIETFTYSDQSPVRTIEEYRRQILIARRQDPSNENIRALLTITSSVIACAGYEQAIKAVVMSPKDMAVTQEQLRNEKKDRFDPIHVLCDVDSTIDSLGISTEPSLLANLAEYLNAQEAPEEESDLENPYDN